MTDAVKFRVGLLVAGSAVLLAFVVVWLSRREVGYASLPCVTYFSESVIGLDRGSVTYYRGVHVGRVLEITTAPGQKVAVIFEVYPAKMDRDTARLFKELGTTDWTRSGLRMRIASSGFTGRKFLEADFYDPRAHPPDELRFEPPPNYIPSAPSTYVSLERGVLDALDSIREADLKQVSESARAALRSLDEAARKLGDSAENLSASARAPLDEMQRTMLSIRRFVTMLERDPSVLLRGR